jgi:hypothetical protein
VAPQPITCATCHATFPFDHSKKIWANKPHLKDKSKMECTNCYGKFLKLDRKNKSKSIGQCQQKTKKRSPCVKITEGGMEKSHKDCCKWTFFMSKGYIPGG